MANRLKDGFSALYGGMNGGIASALIDTDQVAFASDLSFRGGYAKTRDAFVNLPLSFDSTNTQTNWTGTFQGAAWYTNPFGQEGFIVSRGGRLFFLALGVQNVLSEISPTGLVKVTEPFTVPPPWVNPGPQNQVTIAVSDSTPFLNYLNETGGSLTIDGGTYTLLPNGVGPNTLTIGYDYSPVGFSPGATPAAHAVCPDGTVIFGLAEDNDNTFIGVNQNPNYFDFVYLFQAENYMIALAGQNTPLIYDGTQTVLASPNQIPPGVFGIYLWGRIWITLPSRRQFVAGDLVGSSSGTPAKSYVDAILNTTENDFLNGGGAFSMPSNRGLITSMAELAVLDTSLGTGNLIVGTKKGMTSVNTPVDRTTWQNLSYPIQTIPLLGYGPVGPRFVTDTNNDLWFRSADGIRSYKNARREMNEEGNTPQSHEISNLLNLDDESLLFYGSAMTFDNQLYFTVSPYRDSVTNSVAHRGFVTANLDTISNLRNKLPPEWEGVSTGLNILQFVLAEVDEEERGFAFVLNGSDVELWEFGVKSDYDNYTTNGSPQITTRTAIEPVLETRAFTCQTPDTLKQLLAASIYLDQITDNVTLGIFYKPDQHPNWQTWATVNLCANVSQCSILPANADGSCNVMNVNKRQYAAKIILPEPDNVDNPLVGRPMNWGYEFQVRIQATGKFRLRKFFIECQEATEPKSGYVKASQCQTVAGCDPAIFGYNSHGGN